MRQTVRPFSTAVLIIITLATILTLDVPAYAQGTHVALGADVTKRVFRNGAFSEGVKPSLLYRIRRHRHPQNGWRFRVPEFGFNWFGADVDMPVAGQVANLGHLNIRPVMGGVAEAFVANEGKDELSFTVLAGPAFSHFRTSNDARDAYRARLGADPISIKVRNTFVVRPGFSYWHDLGHRLAFHAAINYIIARPEAVIRTPSGETKSRWTTDNVVFKAGLAVGIF